MDKLPSFVARPALCFVAFLSLSACDNSTWADVGGAECKNGKPQILGSAVSASELSKEFGPATCMTRQKNFSGEGRCNGDKYQVKCN
jgi:hypothetical protein